VVLKFSGPQIFYTSNFALLRLWGRVTSLLYRILIKHKIIAYIQNVGCFLLVPVWTIQVHKICLCRVVSSTRPGLMLVGLFGLSGLHYYPRRVQYPEAVKDVAQGVNCGRLWLYSCDAVMMSPRGKHNTLDAV